MTKMNANVDKNIKSVAARFKLINYFDVWGNAKDGWEINNQCVEFDDLYITDDCSKKEILDYLKNNGYLTTSDMRRLEVVDYGEVIEINERKGGKPLYGLQIVYQKGE